MLDFFGILTKGGFVLWEKTFTPLHGSPVDALIKNVLIEERAGTDIFYKDSYAMKWTFSNEMDLVFVVSPMDPALDKYLIRVIGGLSKNPAVGVY